MWRQGLLSDDRRALGRLLLFAAIAAIVMLPALIGPVLTHDSFWIDYIWVQRFTAALCDGQLYPRWLDASFEGLGAPVFYFYAPLSFYAAAAFSALGLSTYGAILAVFAAALFVSGITMYAWLRGTRFALPGACLYMVLPYHLLDFTGRGAMAEFVATAILPLIAIGVQRAVEKGRFGLLAFSYAALILTHLPAALLASLFLIAPWGVLLLKSRPRGIWPLGIGLFLGLGLAAIYLLPALSLQHFVNIDALWRKGFRTGDLSFFTPQRWESPGNYLAFVVLTAIIALPAAVLLILRRGFWAALAVICCLLIAGVVPHFWSLPLLAKVQFPWRTLLIAEFALVTALAKAIDRGARPTIALLAFAPALCISMITLIRPLPSAPPTLADLDHNRPEVIEYTPARVPFETTHDALVFARTVPPVRVTGDITEVRRFYFPRWQVNCNGRPAQSFATPNGLLAYRGPPGCVITSGPLPIEWIGFGISLAALLILIGAQLSTRVTWPILRPARGTRLP